MVAQPNLVHTIAVEGSETLQTLLSDLQNAPEEPGELYGLLGTMYTDKSQSIDSLQKANALASSDEKAFVAWVSNHVNYPRTTSSYSDKNVLTDYLDSDALGLTGYTGYAATETLWDTVFVFDGYLHIENPGTYTFEVRSDDGFQLDIDNKLVAKFDGTRAYAATQGTHTFSEAGFYRLRLLHYNDGGNIGLEFHSNITGELALVPNNLLYLPQSVVYEVVSTNADAEALSPLDEGLGYSVIPSFGQANDSYGLLLPVAGQQLTADAAAQDTLHRLRIPGNDPIPGLTDGDAYYLIVDQTRPGVIQLAPSRDAARDGQPIDLGSSPSLQVPVDASRTTIEDGLVIVDADNGFGEVVGGGDFNGDMLRDLLVAAPSGTYVVYGRPDSAGSAIDLSTLDATTGVRVQVAGADLAAAGDVNDDGIDDLLIGDAANNRVSVVFGRTAGLTAVLSSADAVIHGQNGDVLGTSVALADVNADGVDDLVLGARQRTLLRALRCGRVRRHGIDRRRDADRAGQRSAGCVLQHGRFRNAGSGRAGGLPGQA